MPDITQADAPAGFFFECTRFFAEGAPPPVLPGRDTGELAAGFFVAPRAAVGAAARAFAGAFFGIAIPPKYCFSWSYVQISLCFRLPFPVNIRFDRPKYRRRSRTFRLPK
jgi:hypothetical protein